MAQIAVEHADAASTHANPAPPWSERLRAHYLRLERSQRWSY